MKSLLSILLVLSIMFSTISKPALATYSNPYFLDITVQKSNVAGIEHYVFWKTYLYSMFTDDPWLSKPLKWWTTSNTILTEATNTINQWNANRPIGVEAMTQASSASAADLTYNYANCPGQDPDDVYGCFSVDTWTLIGNLNVNMWYKASIYIRPDNFLVPNSSPPEIERYGTGTLQALVIHETGHALGLNDQYHWWVAGTCNSGITTIMDGFPENSSHYLNPCDAYTPTNTDKTMWNSYHTGGRYLPDAPTIYSDGKASTAWYDYSWKDMQMQATWMRGDTSNGPWIQFAQTFHIGENGSHYDVPGASSRRVIAYTYPTYYNVHAKYIRVCVRPIYSWAAPIGEERCMTPFYFPY